MRKNLWPFDSFKKTTIHRRKGVTSTSNNKFRGYMIYKQAPDEFTVPALDTSVFDSKKDAQDFIREHLKYQRNPARKSNPIRSAAQYRLARAVASGTVRKSTGLTPAIAREMIAKTPKAAQKRFAKGNRGAGKKRAPKKNVARRRNSLEGSQKAYRDFHGRDSEKTVTVVDKIHQHKFLAGIGDLVGLVVLPPGLLRSRIKLSFDDGAVLAQNEKRSQLFIRGGDQSVDLPKFGIYPPYHESEVLGLVQSVDYYTRKDHLRPEDGGEAVYRHKFGGIRSVTVKGKKRRMRSPKPTLIYDSVNKLLSFAGGGYTIPDEGIDN